MAKTNPPDDDAEIAKKLFFQEFLIDFLGGLVPGILFLVAATFAAVPPLLALFTALKPPPPPGSPDPGPGQMLLEALSKTQNTPSAVWISAFVIFVLLAYVIGHLFYRHDLKRADRASFARLAKTEDNKTDEGKKRNLACSNVSECEFPYPYYHLYLQQRGLTHLVPLAVWRKNQFHRSKTYINTLKIRLKHYYPDKCGTIIKNEAHVRLASSAWYVSLLLIVLAVVAIVVVGAALIISWSRGRLGSWSDYALAHLPGFVAPAIVLGMAAFSRKIINGFLHYQRLREVFFVLETAFTAFRDNTDRLDPPFPQAPEN